MPTNYNFKENWYDIIVPLLNTTKVKNAIKKGLLGYINEGCEGNPKLNSFKLDKNSSPADYSEIITDKEMNWENDLIDILESTQMVIPFPCDNYDDEKKKIQILN